MGKQPSGWEEKGQPCSALPTSTPNPQQSMKPKLADLLSEDSSIG